MLRMVRTHAESWLVKSVLWLVVAAFIGTIFYSWGMGGSSRSNPVVATVNDQAVTHKDFRRSYFKMLEYYREEMKGNLDENMTRGIKQAALDNLIHRRLLVQKAQKEGLLVTDSEVRETIRNMAPFQVSGQFKEDIYQNFLNNNGYLPQEFEENMREDILVQKMDQLVKGSVAAADQEVKDLIYKMEEKVKLRYLLFTGDEFKNRVALKEEDIKSYFENNKEKFRTPEKRSAEYILASAKDFIDKARVADDEAEDYYYENIKEFQTQKEVRARHILVMFPNGKNAPPSEEEMEKTFKEAGAILDKVKNGEDFSRLARKYSADKGSAAKGGDLGFFRKGMMVKPFEEAAFSLKKGEVSGLVRSPFGYHIIRVEDIHEEKTESLEGAKNRVIEIIKKMKGTRRASRHLKKLLQDSGGQQNKLEIIAKEFDTEILKTSLFSRTDKETSHLEKPSEVIQEVFSLREGEISNPLEVTGGFYLFRIKDMVPSAIPSLKDVEKEVRSAVLEESAEKLCEEEVAKLQEKLAGGKSLEKIGSRFGLQVKSSEPYNQDMLEAHFQFGRGEVENIFLKKAGETGSIKVLEKHYLYQIKEKEKPDASKFLVDKEKYVRVIMQGKRNSIFSAWLDDLKKEAKIEINESMID